MQLSVIIPVYNVEKYIQKCIQSVLENDLNQDNFEIIIVDDQSPDKSIEIAQKIAQKHKNIKIISQKNKGLGGARNTGISNSLGKYLLFLDSDDWYLPNTLSEILDLAIRKDLDILEFSAQGISTDGKIMYHIETETSAILDGIKYYNKVRYMNSACNKLYKNEFLVSNNLFFLERIFIEDFEFNTRAFSKANRVCGISFLVAQFLQSEDSITRNNDDTKKTKMINDLVFVLQETKKTYNNFPKSKNSEVELFFEERMSFLVANIFYQMFKNKTKFSEFQKMKTQLKQQNLFYINHFIFQKNKNWFRKIMINNFWIFKITQPLLRVF